MRRLLRVLIPLTLLAIATPAAAAPQTKVSISDASVTEGNTGVAEARFTITLNQSDRDTVTVRYATADASATAPSDYQSTSGTVTFAPGETSKTVSVFVNGDTADEGNETFLVKLSSPTNAQIGDGQGVGTIVDDDGTPKLAINNASVTEGNSGSTTMTFTVTLSPAATGTVTVAYSTADGTATTPSDYIATAGLLSFSAGQTAKSITVTVNGDTTDEPNENLFVNLSNPSGAALVDNQGLGVILDDDGAVLPEPVTRLSGDDRVETAIAGSVNSFPAGGSASAVVLARSDDFADALAGTPLAVTKSAPLLLTAPAALDSRTETEIRRVLPSGRTVYLLGGEAALGTAVAARLAQDGYAVERYSGPDRFATAVDITSRGLGNPLVLVLVTGADFPDALSGGAAASALHGGVLLTNGATMHPTTDAYIRGRPASTRFAIGPAAAGDPGATPIVGEDRYDTSARVAARFFIDPDVVGIASGVKFPDGLAGGAHIGKRGGPLLLVAPTSLPPAVQGYLSDNRDAISAGFVYGGVGAVDENVRLAVQGAITG